MRFETRHCGLPRVLIFGPAVSLKLATGLCSYGSKYTTTARCLSRANFTLAGGERQWYKHTSGVLDMGCSEFDGQ